MADPQPHPVTEAVPPGVVACWFDRLDFGTRVFIVTLASWHDGNGLPPDVLDDITAAIAQDNRNNFHLAAESVTCSGNAISFEVRPAPAGVDDQQWLRVVQGYVLSSINVELRHGEVPTDADKPLARLVVPHYYTHEYVVDQNRLRVTLAMGDNGALPANVMELVCSRLSERTLSGAIPRTFAQLPHVAGSTFIFQPPPQPSGYSETRECWRREVVRQFVEAVQQILLDLGHLAHGQTIECRTG